MGAALFDSYGEVHLIQKHTLIIHGCNDRFIPVSGGELLGAQIPNSWLLLKEKCGHMPMFETADFYQNIAAFLTGKTLGKQVEKTNPGQKVSRGVHTLALAKKTWQDLVKKEK